MAAPLPFTSIEDFYAKTDVGERSPEEWKALVLKDFDFELLHKQLLALNWRWGTGRGETGEEVPTIEMLQKEAERLLTLVIDGDSKAASCGGFWAIRQDTEVFLLFAIENAHRNVHYRQLKEAQPTEAAA